MRNLDVIDFSATVLGLFLIAYGLTGFLDARNPGLTFGWLVVGLLFYLGCIALFITHSYLTESANLDRTSKLNALMLSLAAVPALYVISYFRYLPPGGIGGTLVGSLAGAYLLTGLKLKIPQPLKGPLASVLLGACLFFVLQDLCFDTLTLASSTLAPRINKGDKVLVNKLAFGIRTPFYGYYLAAWGEPSRGDLIVFRLDDGRLFVKEVIESSLEGLVVKDVGIVRRNRLLGRVLLK